MLSKTNTMPAINWVDVPDNLFTYDEATKLFRPMTKAEEMNYYKSEFEKKRYNYIHYHTEYVWDEKTNKMFMVEVENTWFEKAMRKLECCVKHVF